MEATEITKLFVGIVFGSFVFGEIVLYLVDKERRKIHTEEKPLDIQIYLGWLERALYILAWHLNESAFIPAWLALKTAGNWKSWEDGQKGRQRFLVFLYGSGLSVLAAGGGIWLIWFLPS
jgi:hypothetical protein